MNKITTLGILAVTVAALATGGAFARSIKSELSTSVLSSFCAEAGLGEHSASLIAASGSLVTGSVHCEAENMGTTAQATNTGAVDDKGGLRQDNDDRSSRSDDDDGDDDHGGRSGHGGGSDDSDDSDDGDDDHGRHSSDD